MPESSVDCSLHWDYNQLHHLCMSPHWCLTGAHSQWTASDLKRLSENSGSVSFCLWMFLYTPELHTSLPPLDLCIYSLTLKKRMQGLTITQSVHSEHTEFLIKFYMSLLDHLGSLSKYLNCFFCAIRLYCQPWLHFPPNQFTATTLTWTWLSDEFAYSI